MTLSIHAKFKLRERRLTIEQVSKALATPENRYYDTVSGALVSVASVKSLGDDVSLVVVYRREADAAHVVTAYPVKEAAAERRRKVRLGR